MVDNIVDLVGRELMEDWNGNSAVGEGSQKSYGPVGAVASAECHLVTFLHTAALKENVQFFDFAGNIMILQGLSLEISECIPVPVVNNAFLYILVEARYLLHNLCGCLYSVLIQIAFDALFGCFLKFVIMEDDRGKLAVLRQLGIETFTVLLHDFH